MKVPFDFRTSWPKDDVGSDHRVKRMLFDHRSGFRNNIVGTKGAWYPGRRSGHRRIWDLGGKEQFGGKSTFTHLHHTGDSKRRTGAILIPGNPFLP